MTVREPIEYDECPPSVNASIASSIFVNSVDGFKAMPVIYGDGGRFRSRSVYVVDSCRISVDCLH